MKEYTFYSFYGTDRELKDIASVLIERGIDFQFSWMTKTIETVLPNSDEYALLKAIQVDVASKHKTSRLNKRSEIQTDATTLHRFYN